MKSALTIITCIFLAIVFAWEAVHIGTLPGVKLIFITLGVGALITSGFAVVKAKPGPSVLGVIIIIGGVFFYLAHSGLHYSEFRAAQKAAHVSVHKKLMDSYFKANSITSCHSGLTKLGIREDPFTLHGYLVKDGGAPGMCNFISGGPDGQLDGHPSCFYRIFMDRRYGVLYKSLFARALLGDSQWDGDLVIACEQGFGCEYSCPEKHWASFLFEH